MRSCHLVKNKIHEEPTLTLEIPCFVFSGRHLFLACRLSIEKKLLTSGSRVLKSEDEALARLLEDAT